MCTSHAWTEPKPRPCPPSTTTFPRAQTTDFDRRSLSRVRLDIARIVTESKLLEVPVPNLESDYAKCYKNRSIM